MTAFGRSRRRRFICIAGADPDSWKGVPAFRAVTIVICQEWRRSGKSGGDTRQGSDGIILIIMPKQSLRILQKKNAVRAAAARAGMSMVEVMIALTVLTVTVFMLTSTMGSSMSYTSTKMEKALASDAARNLLETMRAEQFSQLFARYNNSPEDDPGGAGSAPGAFFAVEGLEPLPNNPSGKVGEVLMASPGPSLREDVTNSVLGFPRDVSGDSNVDDKNHALDYMVLPVGIKVEWKGKSGKQTLVIYSMFSKLSKD